MTLSKRPAPDVYLAGNDDRMASSDVASLGRCLTELRAVVGGLAPARMSGERLPAAQAEIVAIRREADDGVARILSAAEAILAMPDGAVGDAHRHAIAILEACGFHDLIGQRLRHVSDILATLETRLAEVAGCAGVVDTEQVETASQRLWREQTLNGPGLNGPDVLQSDIDAMFE